jgi:polar amino acid transport system permease protein
MASDSLRLPALTAPTWRRTRSSGLIAAAVAAAVLLLLQVPTRPQVLLLLVHWAPYLLRSFLLNILISLTAVGLGSLVGLGIAVTRLLPVWPLRRLTDVYVLIFRNAPLLALVFAASFALPYQIRIGGAELPFPDWMKVTVALALPASAQVAEILRGAIQSIATAQWDTASAFGFSRIQALRWIILPQCLRRALPPWMNLYSTITMGTSLASLAGVEDLLHAATSASQAVHRTDFTIAVFPAVLLCFFLFCHPIDRLTRRLERRLTLQTRDQTP